MPLRIKSWTQESPRFPEGRRLFSAMSVKNNLLMGAYLRRDGQEAIQKDLQFVFDLFPILAERMGQNAGTFPVGSSRCAP